VSGIVQLPSARMAVELGGQMSVHRAGRAKYASVPIRQNLVGQVKLCKLCAKPQHSLQVISPAMGRRMAGHPSPVSCAEAGRPWTAASSWLLTGLGSVGLQRRNGCARGMIIFSRASGVTRGNEIGPSATVTLCRRQWPTWSDKASRNGWFFGG
jgi:hypothetical protein